MGNTNNRPIRTVDGFCFQTEQDAELADLERKKIAYLESKMDYSNPDSILRIYEKAIQDNIFKTPVGFFYLKHLQEYLLHQNGISREDVEPTAARACVPTNRPTMMVSTVLYIC